MAKNLYNLTEVTTVNNSDLLHVNQGSVSSDKKVTKQNLLKEVNSSISSINNSLTKSYPSITKHTSVTNDAIYVTKIGYIVYVSGYFKVSSPIGSGQHLVTFTGLTTGFQLQYLFIHNANNVVSARLETSNNGTNPSLKVSTQISGSEYHYIDAVLVCV